MKEIGSEFWDVPITSEENNIFPKSAQWFLSGRSALQAIVKELGDARSVSLPAWCCESMIKPFLEAGMAVRFYPVYWQNELIQEVNQESDVLFLMDYFGHTGSQTDISSFSGTLIRDMTHSIFSAAHSDADFCFGSLRKWCGVWTGGYAWTKDGHKLFVNKGNESRYVSLRNAAMQRKADYINGYRTDKSYLKMFNDAEEILEYTDISLAVERDIELANKLDVKMIASIRRRNAKILREAFSDWLIFSRIHSTDTPMFVPILVPGGKRNELRSYLIKHDIYCPIHWPVSKLHRLDDKSAYIYENELSLVCDQRYNMDDMYRMVETIKEFFKES